MARNLDTIITPNTLLTEAGEGLPSHRRPEQPGSGGRQPLSAEANTHARTSGGDIGQLEARVREVCRDCRETASRWCLFDSNHELVNAVEVVS